MKRTFNTKRTKVRGMFPYIVRYTDDLNKDIYLFEVTRKTSLRQILKIEYDFEDEEIIFATIDPNFSEYMSTIDAANLYKVGDRGLRMFYFYENGLFYDTEMIHVENAFPSLRLIRTKQIVQDIRMTY